MEEDIKILEEFSGTGYTLYSQEEIIEAVKNVLIRLNILKDKEKKLIEVTNLYLNSIPKSKIKEKIEELEKYIYKGENAPQDFLQYRIKAKIQVLQELLEEE